MRVRGDQWNLFKNLDVVGNSNPHLIKVGI